MSDHEDSPNPGLRAVQSAGAKTAEPTDELERAFEELESKVQFPDGLDGIVDWVRSVSSVIDEISTGDLEATRAEIKELIDHLLELNAQVQNLVRLKQLLS